MSPPDAVSHAPLEASRVNVVFCDPARFDAGAEATLRQLLSTDERQRRARFLRPHLQHDFTLARALVRLTLGRACGVPPQRLRFDTHPHGRPYLPEHHVHFNLSHTHGLIALAWSHTHNIGVDVEAMRSRDVVGLVDRHFAAPESARIRALSGDDAVSAFYRTWTLKESYIKARGLGLALPLDGFAFELDPPTVRIDTHKIDDDGARWWFKALHVGDDHRGALAVESAGPVPVDIAWTTPSQLLSWADKTNPS